MTSSGRAEQQQDSPRVAEMIAQVRRHAALIGGAVVGTIRLGWNDTAPVSTEITLSGPWTMPAGPRGRH
jgi:hypothetical protein